MTNKQIETAREIRLWLAQIIAPATLAALVLLSNPKTQRKIERSFDNAKKSVKRTVESVKGKFGNKNDVAEI